MKIAITGGAGFIGARLADALRQDGHDIVVIDHAGDNPIDIMDADALIRACAGCETIYHLAAAHRDDIFPRSRYYDINGKGTKNVIDAAETNGIQTIIFTSTFAVYGLNSGLPDEESQLAPFNDYGKSKLEAEAHIKMWTHADPARRGIIVRPVVVFGEGNRGNVYTLIRQIAAGKFVMIGGGRNKKSMAYVGNVAGFLRHCLSLEKGFHLYNYADKPDLDMNTLTEMIYHHLGQKKTDRRIPYGLGLAAGYGCDVLARLSGKTLPISAVRVRKFCADTTCAAEKCKQAGFRAKFTIEQGLAQMIDHDFKAAPKESPKESKAA